MIKNYPLAFEFGTRLYETNQNTIGQFFNFWFKPFLEKLEPIDEKLIHLQTMLTIIRLYFDKVAYSSLESLSDDDKIALCGNICWLFDYTKTKKNKFVVSLQKKLSVFCSKSIE